MAPSRRTPSDPTPPRGGRPALEWLPPLVVGGTVAVSGTAPLVVDQGWMWVAPALVWPAAIVWAFISDDDSPHAGGA